MLYRTPYKPVAALCASLALLLGPNAVNAQTFLSEAEMLATFPGHQVQGTDRNGKPWAQLYGAPGGNGTSGAYNGVASEGKYKGTWAVKNGQWCEETQGWTGCYSFVRKGAKTFVAYKDGKKQREWVITK